jgi:thioredoxin 1
MIYHDLDTVDGRKCVKIISSREDGSMSFTDTTWIDTTVNVRNEQSPSGKGLDIKNIGVMKRGKIKMGSTQQLVSIEEMDVPDSLFILPQLSSPTTDNNTATSSTSKSKYMVETLEGTFRSDIESGVVLVDFWATWCAPCQVLTPKMEAIAQKHADEVKVLKLDVDKCKSLAKEYKAEFIPMVVVMKDGKEIGRLVGADFQNTEEVIWQKIKAIIK